LLFIKGEVEQIALEMQNLSCI